MNEATPLTVTDEAVRVILQRSAQTTRVLADFLARDPEAISQVFSGWHFENLLVATDHPKQAEEV